MKNNYICRSYLNLSRIQTPEMKKIILYISTLLLASAGLWSCSAEMMSDEDMAATADRCIFITGIVTDMDSGNKLEDIEIEFKAYPQNNAETAPPVAVDQVYTNSEGIFTIICNGYHEPLLCVLVAKDAESLYESQTKQIMVTWSGPSYDHDSNMFVVNDCTFQLKKAE